MSETGLSQSVILDISALKLKSKFYQCFGFTCQHAYSSNPSLIDLFVSKDGISFKHWSTLNPQFKGGRQLFAIEPIGPSYKYLEIIVKETYGANRTYMNQIFLIEKHPKFQHKFPVSPQKKQQASFFSPDRQSQMEEQMNQYLHERHRMPSEIQAKQRSTSASKKTQTDCDGFMSQDFFSVQSQQAKPTPNFNHQQLADPQQYCEILGVLQVNFNQLCDKLKNLQGDFEQVQNEFQQSVNLSPQKQVNKQSVVFSPSERSLNQPSQQLYSHRSVQSNVTPRDELKHEIMGECLTFCQNQIQQLASQRSGVQVVPKQEVALEHKLQHIIGDWQKKFFDEYVQPTMQQQFDQIEQKILFSIDKKSALSSQQILSRQDPYQPNLSVHETSPDHGESKDYRQQPELMFEQMEPMSQTSYQEESEDHAQKEIKKIAQVLQQKLTIKAEKLKILQQQQLQMDINEELMSQQDYDYE